MKLEDVLSEIPHFLSYAGTKKKKERRKYDLKAEKG
jgi:hypothetical protein